MNTEIKTPSYSLQTYEETQRCIDFVRAEMKKSAGLCDNARTIDKSNELYYFFLAKAKEKAFKLIDTSLSKPYVIYRVNKYFFF